MKKLLAVLMIAMVAIGFLTAGGATESTAKTTIDFPTKPVELIVGFAAGGGTHIAAELLSPEATEFLGKPLQITTKPGAGGAIGATYVADSKPDGYTLLYATMSLPISLYMDSVDFKKDDFVGIACASNVAPVLAVRADAPYNNAAELIAWTKAHPGQFSWSHPGVGSTLHVLGADMMFRMGIIDTIKEVPFSGTGEGTAAVLGGHVNSVVGFPTSFMDQVAAGKMKILGVSSPQRIAEFPNVPTFLEQGYKAVLTSTRGVFAPADTPKEVLDILDKAFEKIINSESYKQRGTAIGEPPMYANARDFNQMYQDQCNMIEELLITLGLI